MPDDSPDILLVEDNAKDVKLTQHSLKEENLGNRIEVVRDGEEALDFIYCRGCYAGRRLDRPPRLVLLDLKLPKVDGLEVLRVLKSDSTTKVIPIVILTSSKEGKDLIESYQLGANAYIQKPVDFDKFRQVIKQLGLFWLVVNEPPPLAAFQPKKG